LFPLAKAQIADSKKNARRGFQMLVHDFS